MKSSVKVFSLRNYDLTATLNSGQAFRWRKHENAWVSVIQGHWVRLEIADGFVTAETTALISDWNWLENYLQIELELESVVAGFPQDPAMNEAAKACAGLRLLRQDPWECLASFILSSTKQIVQIQQIITELAQRYGEAVIVPPGHLPAWTFPSAERIAGLTEAELRVCKMGFRAPNLLAAAKAVHRKEIDLDAIKGMELTEARATLMKLAGVGPKITDCVLLFAYGFPGAFPVDVWVMKALRQLYFPKRKPSAERLKKFISTYFGPHPGYAQQYLFHYMRTRRSRRIA